MIPISDDNPTERLPLSTFTIIALIGAAWIFFQGAGFSPSMLAASVCNFGLVAGELTRMAPEGQAVPIGPGLSCLVDRDPINLLTPLSHQFLHGNWGHILSNLVFFWVFGDNVEDAMGRIRFVVFYFLCGFGAAIAQIAIDPASPIPMVGASGAISGVMGSYLLLYPRARVNMLFIIIIFIRILPLPAWVVLAWWFALQLLSALPLLVGAQEAVSAGVAFMAHVGGFAAGLILTPLFVQKQRRNLPRRQN